MGQFVRKVVLPDCAEEFRIIVLAKFVVRKRGCPAQANANKVRKCCPNGVLKIFGILIDPALDVVSTALPAWGSPLGCLGHNPFSAGWRLFVRLLNFVPPVPVISDLVRLC